MSRVVVDELAQLAPLDVPLPADERAELAQPRVAVLALRQHLDAVAGREQIGLDDAGTTGQARKGLAEQLGAERQAFPDLDRRAAMIESQKNEHRSRG